MLVRKSRGLTAMRLTLSKKGLSARRTIEAKAEIMKQTNELDKYGHLPGDELRENIVTHYMNKAPHGLTEKESWVGGTSTATTRREKAEILKRLK